MKAPKRMKAPAGPPAPQTHEECAAAIAEFGKLEARRAALLAELAERQRAIAETYQGQITELDGLMLACFAGIQTFAEAHRSEAEAENVKYLEFTTGRVEWRKAQDAIAAPAKADTLATVIQMLEARSLGRFIRTTQELNKDAMLAEREVLPGLIAGIPGLSIRTGRESFTVKPHVIEPTVAGVAA
jgi:phage host-nuclease inhibitor protein Gam